MKVRRGLLRSARSGFFWNQARCSAEGGGFASAGCDLERQALGKRLLRAELLVESCDRVASRVGES